MSNANTMENKKLLWQLLLDRGAFSNIPNSAETSILQNFEKIVETISNNTNAKLLDKNKQILIKMRDYLSNLQRNTNVVNISSVEVQRPLQEVNIKLDNDLKQKEEEFMKLIKKPTPAEVNFKDKEDAPINSADMESIVADMIKKREMELDQTISKNSTSISEIVEVKKDSKQKVTFSEKIIKDNIPDNPIANNDNVENFFTNLVEDKNYDSKNEINMIEISIMLKKILANQEKILDIVQPKKFDSPTFPSFPQ